MFPRISATAICTVCVTPLFVVVKDSMPVRVSPLKSPAGQDWVAFLIDTERAYVDTLRDYLKKELGARANVTCS